MSLFKNRTIEQLPTFKYFPDPIGAGSIKESNEVCMCCKQSRGYIYDSSFYSTQDNNGICPWCIADGSASDKFEGEYNDSYPLEEDGINSEIIAEVCCRTPGFSSWQQEVWLSCCKDACEFHSDVSNEEMNKMSFEAFKTAFHGSNISEDFFEQFKGSYRPFGNPSIYKWVCRHCRDVKYYADFS